MHSIETWYCPVCLKSMFPFSCLDSKEFANAISDLNPNTQHFINLENLIDLNLSSLELPDIDDPDNPHYALNHSTYYSLDKFVDFLIPRSYR